MHVLFKKTYRNGHFVRVCTQEMINHQNKENGAKKKIIYPTIIG